MTASAYPQLLAAELHRLGGTDLCVYAAGVGEFAGVTDLSGQTRVLEVNLIGAARTLGGRPADGRGRNGADHRTV